MPPRIPFPAIARARFVPRTSVASFLFGRAQFSTSAPKAFGLKPKRTSSSGSPVLLEASRAHALSRKQTPTRTGVLAYKTGMTAIYDENGVRTAATVLQLDRVQVLATKHSKTHGYFALQVGFGWRQPKNITRPMLGHYEACGVAPKKELREFRVKDESGLLPPGTVLNADHFTVGQFVDVKANSKGKGFAGGMKRWGFSGQPASHGNSLTHRAMGSAGQSQGGGSRVLPGKRMAGRMGGQQHTVQNLKVLQVQPELGLVIVKGAVSGPKGCIVAVQDAVKRPLAKTATA
ncbi:54S ribosomal protein L9 [Pyronema domesticum]|uniref:Large ribosomal subunit protein uL3m n=1 Tax=Pyronema omphalodes (strain CBS 100304) TaxID=1076935 RepID=U4LT96_PYROM|nr:54S ribosomal protein L9 [Pyronema domesticum]CCX34949.1 Similar to 54S ribosomal protein L9, mitochondrial; acc. no. P31334 [Pyronema omphalodes CBS 100304]